MALPASTARHTDIDPKLLWERTLLAIGRARRWSIFRWMAPDVPVHVLRADDTEAVWLGDAASAAKAGAPKSGAFVAVELPEALVLRRRILVPAVNDVDIANAAELEVRGVTPFGADDLAWGFCRRKSSSGAIEVEIALASRKQIGAHLIESSARLGKFGPPEVWAVSAYGAPIVFRGYAESRRSGNAAVWRRAGYCLLLVGVALISAIAVTPIAQLRLRTIEAATAFQNQQSHSGPLLQQREKFVKNTERLTTLSALLAETIDPLAVMDLLTRALPDDTSLTGLQMQGLKITISGQTTNTAALMQHLSAQEGLREVKAPGASMRPAGSVKEAFVIEFAVDAKTFARVPVAPAAPVAMAGTSGVSPAVPAAQPAIAAAANASNSQPQRAAVSTLPVIGSGTPSSSSQAPAAASSGGGAVFGGTPPPPAGPSAQDRAQ